MYMDLHERERVSRRLREDLDAQGFLSEEVLEEHAELVIHDEALLGQVGEERRAGFIRQAVLDHWYWNNCWVRVASTVGVPRAALAEIVLEKLRRTEVDLDSGVVNFIRHDFLGLGCGSVDISHEARRGDSFSDPDDPAQWRLIEEHTLWSVLDHYQFLAALRICVEKAPNLLFGRPDINWPYFSVARRLRLRLSATDLAAILVDAARDLTSLAATTIEELDRLPLGVQLELARRLDGGSLDLVVHLALRCGVEREGLEMLTEWAEWFKRGDSVGNYRRLWPRLRAARDRVIADRVERRLEAALSAEGCILGEVEQGHDPSHRPQLQVRHRGTTYVQLRDQRTRAKPGERVVFRATDGLQLTPKVRAVHFIPAHRASE